MAVLLDAGLIGPCICFAFSRNHKDRAVEPQKVVKENIAVPNVEQNGEAEFPSKKRNSPAIVGCQDEPIED